MPDIETLIVGAGVVGLAVARSLAMHGQEVLVIEQHDIIGSETSARNSEVIHAGIYYPKDSLKAQLCVEGKQLLYAHCQSHGVPHKRLGKLIVATNDDQLQALLAIRSHAEANGVDDLKFLEREEVLSLEPELDVVSGLFSPSTGIIDSHAFMLSLQGDAEAHGCMIAFNTRIEHWQKLSGGGFSVVSHDGSRLTCKNLIICAGLSAPALLDQQDQLRPAQGRPSQYAKGNYFRLTSRAPFSHLIYPVPEPGGLGVHLTLDLGGQARFGPDVEWIDQIDYEVDPKRGEKFYAAIRDYWPGLADGGLEPDYSGIRPKLVGPGEPNADFEICRPDVHGIPGLVALLGIESPGLPASLAIAERVKSLI